MGGAKLSLHGPAHLPSDDSDLGNSSLSIRKEQLGPLTDDSIVFLISSYKKKIGIELPTKPYAVSQLPTISISPVPRLYYFTACEKKTGQ